jgi:ABC-type phosphate transport system substrate-binding protein
MKHLLVALAMLTGCSWGQQAPAQELVVIVNPASRIERLGRDEVINIFMGRYRKFSSGLAAQPIDLPAASPLRRLFYQRLVRKNLAEIDSYWARLRFSGQATPPLRVPDMKTALEMVAENPNAVAYIDAALADKRVKVVHVLGR